MKDEFDFDADSMDGLEDFDTDLTGEDFEDFDSDYDLNDVMTRTAIL
jgi:hypothetical protein